MADQELKLRITQAGAAEVAESLRSVQGAQQGVAASATQAGTAASAAAPKIGGLGGAGQSASKGVDELQAELQNFFAAIPGGERITRIIRLMNMLGDGSVSVGGAARTATSLLSKMSGSLTLLAAGGAVVAGIWAISAAMRSIGEEARRNEEAIKRQTEALNELIKKNRELGQSIEDVASQRPGGGFDARQAEAAAQTGADIRDRLPFIEQSTLAQVLGIFGGASEREGGGARSRDELERIAVLLRQKRIELEPTKGMAPLNAAVDRALARFAQQIDIDIGRERQQRGESERMAREEAASPEGSSVNLQDFIRRTLGPDIAEEDVETIVTLLKATSGGRALDERSRTGRYIDPVTALALRNRMGGVYLADVPRDPKTNDFGFVSNQMLELMDIVRRALERQPATYNQQGSRYYGPDAASRKQRTVNGESLAREAERIGG